ncbi:MAG: dinitrogenase iron-molybdenum cofactor [Firmicutes bacterium]|nr:dinitrogenase iron-molybdenum cofactor [Bacillota bacterium]
MGVKNPSSESVSSSQVATGPKRNSDYKVAIATEGNLVAAHFGHCSDFTIVTVKNSQIEAKEVVPNPGHRPGFLPRYLADLGIDCIIAGGMGGSAQELFTERGIMTIIGVQGPVDDIVAAYVAGNLQVGESLCDHDGETSC